MVSAVAAALVEPRDYPSVVEATVPSDRIALALDSGLPQVDAVIAGIIQPLMMAGVSPENITLVFAHSYADYRSVISRLPAVIRNRVVVTRHDPADQHGLAYLAASHDAHPIYMNRIICDADLVIPVNCLRVGESGGSEDFQAGVFPTFADQATIDRFATPLAALKKSERKRRLREIEEAAWLLGARLTLQVIPGNGDQLLHVIAGDVDSVRHQSRDLAKAAWECEVPERSSLVIAGLEGGPEQQTWENVVRALLAALRVVDLENGTIVLCSELQESPGLAIMQAMSSRYQDQPMLDETSAETTAANRLVEALGSVRVYFHSGLHEDVVSDLGMAPIDDPRDINNLCKQHRSCTVISNSQHTWPTVSDAAVSS